MELTEVARRLGIEQTEALAVGWTESQATLPAELLFLDPAYVAAACRDTYVPGEAAAAAIAASARVARDPALRALAWHGHVCLFRSPAYPLEQIRNWPLLTAPLGDDAGLFLLLILLSNVPELRTIYQERRIPEHVARDTMYDIERRMLEYREIHGAWGLSPRILTWLRLHVQGGIYQLGRLQFQPGAFRVPVRAYRHRESSVVVALSETGVCYRADGQVDGTGGTFDPEGAWTACLTTAEEAVRGNPILPTGFAVHRDVRLPVTDWRQALATGDPVLHIHIPSGSPMEFDACGDSFRQALDFFPQHFPDTPFVAFACNSWLLDPRLEHMLSPTSNMVRFQHEVYLLPLRSNGRSTLERVFGDVPEDLTRAPRDTTLRRAILDHLLSGGHLGGGACFLFPEDMHWGSQVYRRQKEPGD